MLRLYEIAENEGISVYCLPIHFCGSMSMQGYIALDCALSADEERVHLAHEIGHCISGGFYNRYSPHDIIAKHERRADKWAIKMLIPEDELSAAVSRGRTEPWDLAEYFDVTEDFMRKAMCYYDSLRL